MYCTFDAIHTCYVMYNDDTVNSKAWSFTYNIQ